MRALRTATAAVMTGLALTALGAAPAAAAPHEPTATFVGCTYRDADTAVATVVIRNVEETVTWRARYFNADGTTSRVYGEFADTPRRVLRFHIDMGAEQLLGLRIKRGDTVLMRARLDDLEHCGSSYDQT